MSFFLLLRSDLIYTSASDCQSLSKPPLRGPKMDVGKCVCVCVFGCTQRSPSGQITDRETEMDVNRVKESEAL